MMFSSGDFIGGYRVTKQISSGGMAFVVLVEDPIRKNALKISRVGQTPEIDEQNNNAIRKEANLLKSLDHERIVRVFPISIKTDRLSLTRNNVFVAKASSLPNEPWYFAMEYLQGGTLANYVDKCGPLSIKEATNIVGNVGLGLSYLLSKGIAHNDIKPENIVFRTKIKKHHVFTPVLVDFGTTAGVKHFRDEAGSLFVMSPERIRGASGRKAPEMIERIDPSKSDIWSLGIVLYQCLTKKLPFWSTREKRLTSQILNDEPESMRTFNNEIPEKLDRFIIHQCLAKDPNNRPTLREMLTFLYEYSGRGVKAESVKEDFYE